MFADFFREGLMHNRSEWDYSHFGDGTAQLRLFSKFSTSVLVSRPFALNWAS